MLLLLASLPAWATLGQTTVSLKADQARLHGRWTYEQHAGYRVARLRAADGLVLREYVSGAGLVFGVTWRGPRPPDMAALLGRYFAEYQQAAKQLVRRRGPWVLRTAHLVASMSGHLRAFRGSAWIPALMPPGTRLAGSRMIRQ